MREALEKEEICKQLREYILNELLNDPDFPLEYNFSLIDEGIIDSFAIVDLSSFAEKQFKIQIPDYELELENIASINSFSEIVLRALARKA